MIENFLRPPRTLAEWIADGLRVLGVLGVVVAAIWFTPTDAGILAFTLPALVGARFIGVPPAFDIAFSVTVQIAAWSNVIDLYRTVEGWDVVMHLVCTAVLTAMLYEFLARLDVVPGLGAPALRRRTVIVAFTGIGLAISALWEMVEWVGFVGITDDIFVEYHDTIGDMAVGGLGSLIAGIVVAVALTRGSTRGSAEVS
ncbi:hypothetical protein MUN76_10130 [Leucobacter rhizosphaerae]|uniref:DUF2238 domain-containing protein n=1 Tax=Leucobacter rhizosphaerae TaxID=2932245 RepID=A0ABY4FSZ8_9MICO|nr:hypothetical protein [Leucobacter rhizosphaerae]UOQ59411.1 hypothetical protein MUN76_10130 [Leucobacter rhizosphaerae]